MASHLMNMTAAEKLAKKLEKQAFLESGLMNTAKKVRDEYKNVPKTMRMLFLRCHVGNAGFKDRVKLKCLDCCCWDRSEVTNCTVKQCALWKVRPFQPKES